MKQILVGCLALGTTSLTHAAITVTTSQVAAAGTPPSVSTLDLGQTQDLSTTHAGLFNGDAGTTTSPTNGNPATTLSFNDPVTLVLDTSFNTLGYDITGIDSIFGWNPGGNQPPYSPLRSAPKAASNPSLHKQIPSSLGL